MIGKNRPINKKQMKSNVEDFMKSRKRAKRVQKILSSKACYIPTIRILYNLI